MTEIHCGETRARSVRRLHVDDGRGVLLLMAVLLDERRALASDNYDWGCDGIWQVVRGYGGRNSGYLRGLQLVRCY